MNHRFLRITVFLFAFAAFLLPGYWTGKKISFLYPFSKSSATIITNCPRTEQVHFLLINVDNLENRSITLQSTWWIIFSPDSALQWIPLYPSPAGNVERDKKLETAFGLEKMGKQRELRTSFIEILLDQDLCWDGYLVSDNIMLSEIVNELGGINLRNTHLNGSQVVAQEQLVLADPVKSLAYQTELMEEICWNSLHSSITRKLDRPVPGLESHVLLRFSNRIDPINWHNWNQTIKIPTCEFQTKEAFTSLP